MRMLLPAVLAAAVLAGCGTTNGLVMPNAQTGAASALSKAGAEKGVRGMFRYYFNKGDIDKNGFLTIDEFLAAVSGPAPGAAPAQGAAPAPAAEPSAAVKAAFEKADINKNGRVTYSEFATKDQVQQMVTMFRREVGLMFANLDQDGSRGLVAAEMEKAILTFDQADRNKNGIVTLSELEDAMAEVLANGGGFGTDPGPADPQPVAPPAAPPNEVPADPQP